MTIDEKLQHFSDICMENARSSTSRTFEEYASALEQTFQEHKEEASRQANIQLQAEQDKIQREINKELAIEQINQKRILSIHHEELKEKLFAEVENMLEEYKKTPEYTNLLDKQIKAAKEFAGEKELLIYFDPSDSDKAIEFIQKYNTAVNISQYSFGGGIQAIIPAKNILIDYSFNSKLSEAKQKFSFELGGNIYG